MVYEGLTWICVQVPQNTDLGKVKQSYEQIHIHVMNRNVKFFGIYFYGNVSCNSLFYESNNLHAIGNDLNVQIALLIDTINKGLLNATA